jgi:hypothetical protein
MNRAPDPELGSDPIPKLGCDMSGLDDSQLCDDYHYTVLPNLTFSAHSPLPGRLVRGAAPSVR